MEPRCQDLTIITSNSSAHSKCIICLGDGFKSWTTRLHVHLWSVVRASGTIKVNIIYVHLPFIFYAFSSFFSSNKQQVIRLFQFGTWKIKFGSFRSSKVYWFGIQ